jgi:hypothetical protein
MYIYSIFFTFNFTFTNIHLSTATVGKYFNWDVLRWPLSPLDGSKEQKSAAKFRDKRSERRHWEKIIETNVQKTYFRNFFRHFFHSNTHNNNDN